MKKIFSKNYNPVEGCVVCVCVDKSITTKFKKGVYVCVLRGVLRMDVSSFFRSIR